MDYELEIALSGNNKKIKVSPRLYVNNQKVYNVTLDDQSFILFKDNGNQWQSNTDRPVNAEWLQQIGYAIEAMQ